MGWTGCLATAAVLLTAACGSGATTGGSGSAVGRPAPATPSTTVPAPSTPATSTRPSSTTPAAPSSHHSSPPTTHTPHHAPAAAATRLPLDAPAGSARQVITVVAPSTSSTRATVQAWRKVSGGWARVGPAVPAWVGSAGLSTHTSEGRSATPIGSFTLTRAFGADADPGTRLPYTRTTPDDWWISQPGKLYNTRQRCAARCDFTRGDPNEHLYFETPYYDYAVVIDYNTRNAPGGVRQGAGSAFFLHVHPDGTGATAGCVAIPSDQLVRIMRWLAPAQNPRILIGVHR
ncbi:MAG TPA: L,D-transpeptidase family protein [Jatrophihabitans sp.]|nr:L,D-transpeptidase family protein [Jatrophihabitans sp.]